MLRDLGIGLAATLGCACTRSAADEICPAAGTGDLVVTELRGAQSGGDTYGQWVELYNASGGTLDLEGTVVDLLSIDGGTHLRMLVRHPLQVAGGAYVVLGNVDDTARPPWVDYGFGADFAKAMPPSGAITVSACGVQVDRVVFDGLPTMGSYSLGESPPTAAGNDAATAWCTDATPGTDTSQIGLPGTPGTANHPCM